VSSVLLGFSATVQLLLSVARRFRFPFVCGLLHREVGIIFELSDQKARGFLVFIVIKRLFSEYVRKIFGEMSVRI
jgi:hypothetical protein